MKKPVNVNDQSELNRSKTKDIYKEYKGRSMNTAEKNIILALLRRVAMLEAKVKKYVG